jgi:hypothetical protein
MECHRYLKLAVGEGLLYMKFAAAVLMPHFLLYHTVLVFTILLQKFLKEQDGSKVPVPL